METHGHHSIGMVKCLLHAVSVVHIDVQIQHAVMESQEFKDAQNDVIDVAKPISLCLFGVVVPASPINGDVDLPSNDKIGCINAPPSSNPAEVVESLESRTVLTLIYLEDRIQLHVLPCAVSLLFARILLYDAFPLRRHPCLEVLYILGVMERRHFFRSGLLGNEHPHLASQAIVTYQTMRHFYPLRLHRMLFAVLVLRDVLVVEVSHPVHQPTNMQIAWNRQNLTGIAKWADLLIYQTINLCVCLNNLMKPLLLSLSILWVLSARTCTDFPSCFTRVLFDFSSPPEALYPINIADTPPLTQVKAYGDFNADLATDFAAIDESGTVSVYIFNVDNSIFVQSWSVVPTSCRLDRLYLYDINSDNRLDITGWGTYQNGNCLVAFIQEYNLVSFTELSNPYFTQSPTTDPILMTFLSRMGQRGFLLFDSFTNQRVLLIHINGGYQSFDFSSEFSGAVALSNMPFANPHWNTFMDVNGDCRADVIIFNQHKSLQFWLATPTSYNYDFQMSISIPLTSLSFSDANYDGSVDLILTSATAIYTYRNTNSLEAQDEFCIAQPVAFATAITFDFPANYSMEQQSLKFGDLNIDGYPDLLVILVSNITSQKRLFVLENVNLPDSQYAPFEKYSPTFANLNSSVLSASFLDILENGVVDILLTIYTPTGPQLQAFYNNYLYTNSYFLKGYGCISTEANSKGTPEIGIAFYWINSLNNDQKVALQPQTIQTAYDALSLPYALNGLGRANNYVQRFTIGVGGQKRVWSPIIPNSQLAIYVNAGKSSTWGIKIFVMPTEALIYVIMVSILILSILGAILIYFKWKKLQKKHHALLETM